MTVIYTDDKELTEKINKNSIVCIINDKDIFNIYTILLQENFIKKITDIDKLNSYIQLSLRTMYNLIKINKKLLNDTDIKNIMLTLYEKLYK